MRSTVAFRSGALCVPIGDHRAEGRSFVPMVGLCCLSARSHVISGSLIDKLIADQLRFAKPLDASAGQRLQRGV